MKHDLEGKGLIKIKLSLHAITQRGVCAFATLVRFHSTNYFNARAKKARVSARCGAPKI